MTFPDINEFVRSEIPTPVHPVDYVVVVANHYVKYKYNDRSSFFFVYSVTHQTTWMFDHQVKQVWRVHYRPISDELTFEGSGFDVHVSDIDLSVGGSLPEADLSSLLIAPQEYKKKFQFYKEWVDTKLDKNQVALKFKELFAACPYGYKFERMEYDYVGLSRTVLNNVGIQLITWNAPINCDIDGEPDHIFTVFRERGGEQFTFASPLDNLAWNSNGEPCDCTGNVVES